MRSRISAILLAAASWAWAESPVITPDALRAVLDDPNSDVAKAAKGILGPKGGNQLFYFPTHDEPTTPANWGYKFENATFKSGDGTPLNGWFIPARGAKAKATVVFSHGNAGSMSYHIGFVNWLVESGYNVLMYDYRGFGKSGGTVDRRGMIDDVKAAFSYAGKRADVDARRLVSYGHSLGGAKSVTALGESPVKGLRAVVIEGAFASYQTMAGVIGGQLGASLVTDELAPKDYVRKISPVPLLVVHGTRDEVVPVSQGRLLFEKAREPKTIFEVKTGRHGDSLTRDHGAFRKKVIVWLDATMNG